MHACHCVIFIWFFRVTKPEYPHAWISIVLLVHEVIGQCITIHLIFTKIFNIWYFKSQSHSCMSLLLLPDFAVTIVEQVTAWLTIVLLVGALVAKRYNSSRDIY